MGVPAVMRDVTLWAFTVVPPLVLAGEEDILIPVSLSRELHGLIPGAAWATTKGGHA